MSVFPYNRRAAVAYARRWALGRNPRFYDFSDIGGDCTNFASQCLYAGSLVMNFTPVLGWYYLSVNNRTPSWTGVRFLYEFLVTNRTAAVFARETDIGGIQPGDIVQLGDAEGYFYHSPVITEVGACPAPENILVCAHSYDALDRPLSTYEYAQARFLHIEGVYRQK